MFELNGQEVTLDFLKGKAQQSNMDFDTYLEKMKERGLVEKQADSTVDPTVSQDSMGSQSVDGSSELPEDKGWFEDMYTAIKGGAAAGGSVGEAFDVYRQGRNISDKDLKGFIDAAKAMENNPETNEAVSWRNDMKKHGSGALGGFMSLLENPGYFPQFIASSMSTMASSLFDSEEVAAATGVGAAGGAAVGSKIGGLAGTVGGPIGNFLGYIGGAGAGAMGGGMAGLVGAMETGLTLTDLLRDELGEKDFNEKNVRALLNDKDVMDRVKSKSLARGATIGMVEGLTFGLSRGVGGKMLGAAMTKGTVGLSKAGLKTGAKIAGATTAIEMTGGAGGETLGMLAAGQELKGEEIFLEAIGEAKGAVNTSDFVKAAITKSSYKLNKEEVTAAKIKEIIDNPNTSQADLAKMNIDVTGDKAFDAYVKKKQGDAAIDTQIDARITDKADRKKLVDLEIKRNKAKADVKKEGSFKVLNADQALLDVETEIETLLNKYEGAVGFGETTEAKEVAKVRRDVSLEKTIKFLQENKKYAGKDVVIAEDDVSAQLAHDKAVEEYNAKNPNNKIKAEDVTGADGFIVGDVIVINKDIAGKTGQINVGAHELLHGIVAKHMQSLVADIKDKDGKVIGQDKTKLKNLITDFKSTLTKSQRKYVQAEINRRNEDVTNDDGSVTKGEGLDIDTTEEWLTIFSDGITKNDIKFDEGVFDKLKNFVQEIARKVGYFKEFENGRQVYNFMKDYQKSVKAGGSISARAQNLAAGGTTVTDTKASRSTVNLDQGSGDISQKIDALTKGAKTQTEFQQPGGAFDNVYSGMLEGKFDRIFGEGISKEQKDIQRQNLADRLMNYNPAKTPELSKWIYGGSGKAGNVVYAGLVAKKKLFEEGEIRKKTTTIDTKEARELEDTTTPTTEIEDKSKARELKEFDVELNDGLVNEKIVKKVEALLEKNPDNIEAQIEKLILNDIRKDLDASIPKIAKDKKTGKRGPTAEYEAWIRGQYTEVVRSLGMETIRTAYKPWFKQEKTGVKDYSGISKKTGKKTNYVKPTQVNTTNKREYIRWFLEAKPGSLTERRTALIRRIARRKAKIATDNYIETNSASLDAITNAKLRNLSTSIENIQNEQKSFDAIRFSKSIGKRVNELMLEKVKDSKTGKLKPRFGTRGHALEQAIIEVLQSYGLPIDLLETIVEVATEKGGLADITLNIFGKRFNLEVKMSDKVPMGSVLVSSLDFNNFNNYKLAKAEDYTSVNFGSIIKNAQKDIKAFVKAYNKKVKAYNKKHGTKETEITKIGDKMVTSIYDELKAEGLKAAIGRNNEISIDAQPLIDHYLSKPYGGVEAIEIFGLGLYSFLENSRLKNVPYIKDLAKVKTSLIVKSTGRKRNSKKELITNKVGDGYIDFRLQFQNELIGLKKESNVSMINAESINEMFGEQVVLNFSKSPKNTQTINNAINFSRSNNNVTKGITVLDFDDTLATTKSLVKYTRPDGTTGTLNAEEYASTYENLLDQGFTFDFSDFNKVVKGKLAPLFQKALKLQNKFGPENMFILTARPMAAQKAIFDFLKANGLNIPIKNITGLGNSTAEAKALWVAGKVGEGFNDFYFADDALQNVQAVDNILEQFDVKRKVQQARIKFSNSMNENFNDILESLTGIESIKRFSAIKGRKRGEGKGKFRFFIPPSHEDFVGLLYNFLGKGKEGNAHRDFFEQALVRPINRANREYDTARQSIANDYKELNKQFEDVKAKLTEKTPDGDFTNEDAIRIYLWDKHGHNIPGLSPLDQKSLVELVNSDQELRAYAETLNIISKQETYVNPTEGWNAGDIRMDLDDATGRVGRKQYFAEFNENAEIIFSEENLNKIEAGYGKGVRVALEDILYRIKTGRNRPSGSNETVNKFMNFLNGSVGTVMFFNMRSALLQQMSIVNYINFADNNVFAAAKAFANQEQYWADFAFIFNSDMLKQRRGGIQTDVNGAELAASLRKSKNPSRVLISKLLELGFLPTQIGDNIAIATGGAAYYRNTINKYVKQGMSVKEAEAAAFTDFQDITQSTQQSARPDMVSMQQASVLGKVILNFQNVTSQFNRLGKKAFQDIYNRRITKPNSTQMQSDISNAARITYYFAVQNMIFYTLQTALFAMMFDDDEEDNNNLFLKKKERLINGSIDSVLRGTGVMGGVIATLKNTAIAFARQRDVKYNPDESAVVVEALNLSPVIGIKARQIVNAEKTLNYNKKIIDEMETFDIDNPQWSAVTNYVQTFTNLPLNRLYNKTQNVRQALNNDHSAWERSLMFLGWSQYNLDLENKKMEEIKESVKGKKKSKTNTRSRTRTRTRSRTRTRTR